MTHSYSSSVVDLLVRTAEGCCGSMKCVSMLHLTEASTLKPTTLKQCEGHRSACNYVRHTLPIRNFPREIIWGAPPCLSNQAVLVHSKRQTSTVRNRSQVDTEQGLQLCFASNQYMRAVVMLWQLASHTSAHVFSCLLCHCSVRDSVWPRRLHACVPYCACSRTNLLSGVSYGCQNTIRAVPAVLLLDDEVSCARQGTQDGKVACVHQGVHQAKHVPQGTCGYRVGLHGIVCILAASNLSVSCSNWSLLYQLCNAAYEDHPKGSL